MEKNELCQNKPDTFFDLEVKAKNILRTQGLTNILKIVIIVTYNSHLMKKKKNKKRVKLKLKLIKKLNKKRRTF